MVDVDLIRRNQVIDLIEQASEIVTKDEVKRNNEFSTLLHKNTKLDEADSKKFVEDISTMIDLIQNNYEDIKLSKKNGISRNEWLMGKLYNIIENFKLDNTNEFITEIRKGLSESNSNIGIGLFGKEIIISEPLLNTEYNDLNKASVVKDFLDELKINTLLGTIALDQGNVENTEIYREINMVKNYFEAPLDSMEDKVFKKMVSVATVIAQENDSSPIQSNNKSPEEIAMIVDKGVTAAKVAYKLGNDEISPMDAIEYTIDRNTAILSSAITKTCVKYGGVIGGKLGAAIGSIFGPAGTATGVAIGTAIGKVGGYVVGQVIEEGMKKGAIVVKSTLSSVVDGVKSGFNSVLSKGLSFFK